MSNFTDARPEELNGLEAINAQAADWMLAKEMSESWTDEKQAILDAWLAESTSHVAAYWRLNEAWQQSKRLKALRSPLRPRYTEQPTNAKPRILGIAAIVVVGVLLAGGLWSGKIGQSDLRTYSTPVGGHLHLVLPDGSKIELNTDTALAVSTSGNQRVARLLRGEAFFEIRHDEHRPFSVAVGDRRIVDLGTKFVVRRDDNRISVALIEGRARFEAQAQSPVAQATDLLPGDVVTATANSMAVSRQPIAELNKRLSWRKGLLIFDNATLGDAARELNRYNDQKIVISDAAVAQLTIGGTFYENDVPALLNTAHQIFGLRVRKQGNEMVVSR